MNDGRDFEPMETLSITLPDRLCERLNAHAERHRLSLSSVVESALDDFLSIVEQCDPEARAVARSLREEEP